MKVARPPPPAALPALVVATKLFAGEKACLHGHSTRLRGANSSKTIRDQVLSTEHRGSPARPQSLGGSGGCTPWPTSPARPGLVLGRAFARVANAAGAQEGCPTRSFSRGGVAQVGAGETVPALRRGTARRGRGTTELERCCEGSSFLLLGCRAYVVLINC